MDSTIFCVLCGGPFELQSHIYNIDKDREDFQWINSVQLLGRLESLTSDLVIVDDEADLQNTSNSDDVFLSTTTRWTSTDGNLLRLGNSSVHVLSDNEDRAVIFPLHHSCIIIAYRAIEVLYPPPVFFSPLARLNTAMHDHFQYRKYVAGRRDSDLGNDLFDIYTEFSNYGPRSLLAIDELGWWGDAHEKFLMDPINIPNLTSSLFGTNESKSRHCKRPAYFGQPERQPRGLERLPTEIIDWVTEFLPPRSIIALHRTSKALASKIPLDDRFWRNHILDGSLIPHIWDLERKQLHGSQTGDKSRSCFDSQWSWKCIAKLLFNKEYTLRGKDSRLEGVPPGFWNRCRIWKIVEELFPPQGPIPMSRYST